MLELNKLYNMDCMEGMKLIDDESISLIVTDPPYKVTSRGSAGNSGGMLQKDINKSGNVFLHNDILPSEYAPEFYRILKNGSHLYVMTNHVNLMSMLNEFKKAGFHFIKSLIWDKGNKIMGTFYMSQFEYILFFRKGNAKPINNCGTSDILRVPNKKTKIDGGENLHDTEKPIRLYEILIENSTQENEIALDPFGGSGNHCIACENINRRYISFEIDKNIYKMAQKRLDSVKNQIRFA